MVAHQLDLFGGPLKPPKKIKVDDYDIPDEEPKPVEEPVSNSAAEEETISEVETITEEAPPANDSDSVIANDSEWTPEASDNSITAELSDEVATDEMHVVDTDEPDAEIETVIEEKINNDETVETAATIPEEPENEEEVFTNEAIFTNETVTHDEAENEAAEAVLTDDLPAGDISHILSEELTVEDEAESLIETPLESTEPATATESESIAEAAPTRKSKNDHEEDIDGLNVPPDEELFKRQYYSMRETSAMFGVNQSLLRFWENEFDILQPKKNKKGDRYFRPVDIKNLVLIYHLLRVRKFTMDGAKDYLQSHKKAGDTFELIKRLEKLKSFLFELKAGL